MAWLIDVFIWWLYLFVLGLAFFPITKKYFSKFFDWGYPFAKTIGILILSYVSFVLGLVHVLPFAQITLIILLAIAAFLNWQIMRRDPDFKSLIKKPFPRLIPLIAEEITFIIALIFLSFIRGQEPSIRGLEKFMDFGFMQSILSSKFFPPLDMWYSADSVKPNGYPINYYYFGHLTGAFLIKLTNISPFIGYNLILATIFAQGITLVFSLGTNFVHLFQGMVKQVAHSNYIKYVIGAVASFIVNFGGNLHTIYLFTKGYPNEQPVPFWKIFSGFNPQNYWYPNATRFIPLTIHEFPSYSYVVADLHGHVFDIPFVLLTIAILFNFFLSFYNPHRNAKKVVEKINFSELYREPSFLVTIFLGFMIAVHYMTNAFDLLIYLLLTLIVLFIVFKLTARFIIYSAALILSIVAFVIPFSLNFKPFVSGIGVNCAPNFLVQMQKLGPFIFEKGNCQVSAPWMLFVLWGFFIINFILFLTIMLRKGTKQTAVDIYTLVLFGVGTFLILIPEFFYFKDIYPAHFRANTMFKMGYQAFIMMGIASAYTLYRIGLLEKPLRFVFKGIFLIIFGLIFLYPFFAFPSYYGNMKKPVNLNGIDWLLTIYPEDKELIEYINTNIKDQSVILEAQGDSYTDHNRVSSYTGHPTIAGWWVHEWLWRGSSDVVGIRIPDIVKIYESENIYETQNMIDKYKVKYIVLSTLERQKYPNVNQKKLDQIAKKIFTSSNGKGILYKVGQ